MESLTILDQQSMKIDLYAYKMLIHDLTLKLDLFRNKCKTERDYIESITSVDILTLPYERAFEILTEIILWLENERDILLDNLNQIDSSI